MENEIIKQVKFQALIYAFKYVNSSPRLYKSEIANAIKEVLTPDEIKQLKECLEEKE